MANHFEKSIAKDSNSHMGAINIIWCFHILLFTKCIYALYSFLADELTKSAPASR